MSETHVINETVPSTVLPLTILRRITMEYIVIAIGFIVIITLSPADEKNLGALSAIPSIFLLAFIFYTKLFWGLRNLSWA